MEDRVENAKKELLQVKAMISGQKSIIKHAKRIIEKAEYRLEELEELINQKDPIDITRVYRRSTGNYNSLYCCVVSEGQLRFFNISTQYFFAKAVPFRPLNKEKTMVSWEDFNIITTKNGDNFEPIDL